MLINLLLRESKFLTQLRLAIRVMSDGAGRPPSVSDEEILDVFREAADPVLTTSEVASKLPIERRGLLDRLKNLEADGRLQSKSVGGRSVVWWHPKYTKKMQPTTDE